MDRGAWWAIVRGHRKESDMTQWLNNNKVSNILINEILETFLLKRINIQNIKTAYGAQYIKKNPKQSNPKMDGRPKQTFFKEDILMAKRQMKRCSASLIIAVLSCSVVSISV